MYICMSVQTLLKEDIVFRGNFTFPCMFDLVMPSSTFLTVQMEMARGGCEFGNAF